MHGLYFKKVIRYQGTYNSLLNIIGVIGYFVISMVMSEKYFILVLRCY